MQAYRKKKGFTLVELLVVIAILAVLTTVSVVGYSVFIKKAHTSNDIGLVEQMNTKLQANEALGKNKTCFDAINDVREKGFGVDKIAASVKDYTILWDQVADRFLLMDKSKDVVFADEASDASKNDPKNLWKIYTEMPTAETMSAEQYNVYLAGMEYETAVEVTVGFDAGENLGIPTVTYTGANVGDIIRTNGSATNVVINNASADVSLYGKSGTVEVLDAAMESVHIYGIVLHKIDLTKGHVVLEATSQVNSLTISAAAKEDIKVAAVQGSKLELVMAKSEDILTNVEIPATTDKVVNDANNVALYNGTQYATFDEAWNALGENNGEISLLNDVEITKSIEIKPKQNVSLKLNGYTLKGFEGNRNPNETDDNNKSKYTDIKVGAKDGSGIGGKLSVSGGRLILNQYKDNKTSIYVGKGANLKFDKVDLFTNGTGIFPLYDEAFVDVFDSKITVTGGYGISTNASNEGELGGVIINVRGSEIIAKTAICINVPATVNFDGCKIHGHHIGMMVRGGTVTVKNTTIVNTLNNAENLHKFDDANWDTGDDVTQSALTLGNKYANSGAYNYPTQCTLINSKIISDGTFGYTNKTESFPAIYAHSSFDNTVTLNIDDKTEILGQLVKGSETGITIVK